MAVHGLGLTDLERAKYTEDSTANASTVRVAINGSTPIPIEGTVPVDVQNVPHVEVDNTVAATIENIPHVVVDSIPHVIQDTYPILPDKAIAHRIYYFTDGTSPDQHLAMGTLASPRVFRFTATKRSVIDRIDLGIVFSFADASAVSIMDYGTLLGGLTNGIQFVSNRSGTEEVIFTIQRMVHWTHFTRTGMNLPIDVKGQNSEQFFQVSLNLRNIFYIDPGQYIAFKIRDSMLGIGLIYQRASVLVEEI